MITSIIERNSRELLREATRLLAAIERVQPLEELVDYREWLLERIAAIQGRAQDALTVLSYGFDEVVGELLSSTQQCRREFGIIRDRLVSPLIRSDARDRLSLQLLAWLHRSTPMTSNIPFALSDGGFASWPWPPYAAAYFAPNACGEDLRFRPLFFHEFGHVLYAVHTQEFDAIVGELQRKIEQILSPRSVRNDARAAAEARERAAIVETWYEWAQELFCDAVGLSIGGPAYLFAFSSYLQLLGAGDFPGDGLRNARDTHPPTRLRVEMLTSRADRLQLREAAQSVRLDWEAISSALEFTGDYFGMFVSEIEVPLQDSIDRLIDMSRLRKFETAEVSSVLAPYRNPIELTNAAWLAFNNDPEGYSGWESEAIRRFSPQMETNR